MKANSGLTLVLLGFVAVSIGYLVYDGLRTAGPASSPEIPSSAPATQPAHQVIAYYFHSTHRCTTCLTIERLAAEALREQFPAALASGTLVWQPINMEEAAHEHFAREYQLVTSSLVLVDRVGGQQHAWQLVGEVWDHVDDEPAFKKLVADRVRAYLESAP